MLDLTVSVVEDKVRLNNSCCGCECDYSIEEAENLINQIEAAIYKIDYENNRIRNEAIQKVWDSMTPEERIQRIKQTQQAFKKFVEHFYNRDTVFGSL